MSTAGIGIGAVLGVVISSQVLLNQSVETGINRGIQAGLTAALMFLGVNYIRRFVL